MTSFQRIGFVGLGVMGEPICRNLARKSGLPVTAFDLDPHPLERLGQYGVQSAADIAAAATDADVVFLSLPSGAVVEQICRGPGGLLAAGRQGLVIVDLSTSSVDVTRALAADFARQSIAFVDAPVARTRAAAEAGTLSVMVGADASDFERVRPLIATFANEITLCGPVGCGQVVKILNNMILFETVVAIAEAKAIAERAGVDPALLFDTLAKGSADSFALRNHGMKAVLPGVFPERAFSVEYARKDLGYALRLAGETGVDARGARTVDGWFEEAIKAGDGAKYHPVISARIGASKPDPDRQS
ncbi:NAD(P)-dependent oxidoreductase [Candidimonas nitroreducens]|nr:NAD(P)-dependent oxidoreductase [Candidimonas nitroreducens]